MGDKKKEINYSEDAPIEEQLVSILKSLKKTITTAESITGGLISAAITSVEGASDCFKVGYVTYSNKSKRKLLSVKKELLRKEGAVSSATAQEMAIGAMMEGKEVGLIYIAVCAGGKTKVEEFHFGGNRKEVREQACGAALVMVRDYLLDKK